MARGPSLRVLFCLGRLRLVARCWSHGVGRTVLVLTVGVLHLAVSRTPRACERDPSMVGGAGSRGVWAGPIVNRRNLPCPTQ
eukprot:616561-Rhodomonas_salina.3